MLGIDFYGFAFFVAVLVCLIAVLCKYLFADVRRQNKLLDEKESKLLKLYQSVEDVLDEFTDQAAEAREGIEELANEARNCQTELARAQEEALAAIKAAVSEVAAGRERETSSRAASKPKTDARKAEESAPATPAKKKTTKSGARTEGGASFQKIIDELEGDAPSPEPVDSAKSGRNDAILALKAEGKSVQKIAQELGITQNEVKLVIGLNK